MWKFLRKWEKIIFIFLVRPLRSGRFEVSGYDPFSNYESDEELKAVLDWLSSDFFCQERVLISISQGITRLGRSLPGSCRLSIPINAFFGQYHQDQWASKAIHNVAGSGKFSSDRLSVSMPRNLELGQFHFDSVVHLFALSSGGTIFWADRSPVFRKVAFSARRAFGVRDEMRLFPCRICGHDFAQNQNLEKSLLLYDFRLEPIHLQIIL